MSYSLQQHNIHWSYTKCLGYKVGYHVLCLHLMRSLGLSKKPPSFIHSSLWRKVIAKAVELHLIAQVAPISPEQETTPCTCRPRPRRIVKQCSTYLTYLTLSFLLAIRMLIITLCSWYQYFTCGVRCFLITSATSLENTHRYELDVNTICFLRGMW